MGTSASGVRLAWRNGEVPHSKCHRASPLHEKTRPLSVAALAVTPVGDSVYGSGTGQNSGGGVQGGATDRWDGELLALTQIAISCCAPADDARTAVEMRAADAATVQIRI